MGEEKENVPFTKQMRETTRQIHEISDTLVNLKLGVSMSEPTVWREGLLVFYEIFRYLEEAMERNRDSLIGDLIVSPNLFRTAAFEADLKRYYGGKEIWKEKDYVIREPVADYLRHLKEIENGDNPYLLCAYIYHLYMGLFSGGQILAAKRMASFGKGEKDLVADFGSAKISSLKRAMREAMNRIAEELDPETRKAICEEGVKVFHYNNSVIRSVKGVNEIFYGKVKRFVLYSLIVLALSYTVYKKLL